MRVARDRIRVRMLVVRCMSTSICGDRVYRISSEEMTEGKSKSRVSRLAFSRSSKSRVAFTFITDHSLTRERRELTTVQGAQV